MTLDLTDPNIWHFMGELLLPTFHALLNLDLMPRHVARSAFFCQRLLCCTLTCSCSSLTHVLPVASTHLQTVVVKL